MESCDIIDLHNLLKSIFGDCEVVNVLCLTRQSSNRDDREIGATSNEVAWELVGHKEMNWLFRVSCFEFIFQLDRAHTTVTDLLYQSKQIMLLKDLYQAKVIF